MAASNSDYINSNFFPGNLFSVSYLFTGKTLQLRKLMKYHSPSFSEMKFLKSIQDLAIGTKNEVS